MKKITITWLLLIGLTSACSSITETGGSSDVETDSDIRSEEPGRVTMAPESSSNTSGGGGGGRGSGSGSAPIQTTASVTDNVSLSDAEQSTQAAVPSERKIIRDADLRLEADSPEDVQQRVTAIAESTGGFVVESQQSGGDGRTGGRDTVSMTIRVPADKFAAALDEIRKAAGRVVTEQVKGQDVTEEFIDIEARLRATRALELQFMEIMKRATSVDEALNVQRQLASVRGDIEKIEGRKRFLENQASLSTIKIRVQTPAAISASGSGFFYKLTESFGDGLDVALNFVLGLVTVLIAILPFLIFIVLPVYLVARYFWNKARRRKTAAEIAEEEINNG